MYNISLIRQRRRKPKSEYSHYQHKKTRARRLWNSLSTIVVAFSSRLNVNNVTSLKNYFAFGLHPEVWCCLSTCSLVSRTTTHKEHSSRAIMIYPDTRSCYTDDGKCFPVLLAGNPLSSCVLASFVGNPLEDWWASSVVLLQSSSTHDVDYSSFIK